MNALTRIVDSKPYLYTAVALDLICAVIASRAPDLSMMWKSIAVILFTNSALGTAIRISEKPKAVKP